MCAAHPSLYSQMESVNISWVNSCIYTHIGYNSLFSSSSAKMLLLSVCIKSKKHIQLTQL